MNTRSFIDQASQRTALNLHLLSWRDAIFLVLFLFLGLTAPEDEEVKEDEEEEDL